MLPSEENLKTIEREIVDILIGSPLYHLLFSSLMQCHSEETQPFASNYCMFIDHITEDMMPEWMEPKETGGISLENTDIFVKYCSKMTVDYLLELIKKATTD